MATYIRAHGMGFEILAALDEAQRQMTIDELVASLHDQYGNVNPFVLAEIERRGRYDVLNLGTPRGCTMGDQMAKVLGQY